MTTSEIIQLAVLEAHNKNNTIIETQDFIDGAWYLLQALKRKRLMHSDDEVTSKEVYKVLREKREWK